MAIEKSNKVSVAYARPEQQLLITIPLTEKMTVEQAIFASKLPERFPEIDLSQQKVGIFSRQVSLDTQLAPGDRVEIYRPLAISPKQARRLRAKTIKTHR